jgi:hypothetical protein
MATELFKVSCVTCQASLSVRNLALVGQIIACPKCDSMVLVEPPSTSTPIAPVVAAAIVPPAVNLPKFEEPLEDFTASESFTEPIAPPEVSPTEMASVLEAGTSSSVNFIMWSVASFVVGATLMGAVLVWRSGDKPSDATVVIDPAPVVEQPQQTAVEEPTTDPNREQVEASPVEETHSPEPADIAQQTDEPEIKANAPLSGPVVLPPLEKIPSEPPAMATGEKHEPKLVIRESDEPRVARKYDPLQLDPEQMDLKTVSAGAESVSAPPEKVNEPPIAELKADAAARIVNQSPVKLSEKRAATGRRSAETQLQRVFPAVNVKDMPLLNFLALMSQLSGVPVSIAPEQLQMAGISAGRPVSANIATKSIGEILAEVLGPLHLEAQSDGEQIILVRQHGDQNRGIDYPVDDLGNSHTELAQWIEQLVAPETWKSVGGPGTITVEGDKLHIEQTQQAQYEVLIFLERIRLAKEKPLRSKYPERLLSARPYMSTVAEQVAAPAIFTFSHETPLAEVFLYWQTEMGLPVFVDWPALATAKLWPESSITCRIANEPWHIALDKVLEPLGLGWRAVSGGGIQITSREVIDTEPVLDIYPGNEWQLAPMGATVIHDRVNNLTYVRAPAAVHRQ